VAIPVTTFARNGEIHLAYQVFGDGPPNLLLVESWVHHVELVWEFPDMAHVVRRLASFGRLILFDRRGTGLSDPIPLDHLPDLETQVEDAVAVLDAAGIERAAVLGLGDGGPVAMLLTAMHPERCSALVLFATAAKRTRANDYLWGFPETMVEEIVRDVSNAWISGDKEHPRWLAPSRAADERFVDQVLRFERSAVRPGAVAHYFGQTMNADVRHVLPAIQTPTLVLHRVGDRVLPMEHARYLAEHIPGAKLVELPGNDHLYFSEDPDALIEEIEEFLTGARAGSDPDRVLATLLFTDIADSTKLAAEVGDRRLKDLLDRHHAAVRQEIHRFRGREIDDAGDGLFAAFDGPARAVRCAHAIVEAVRTLGLQIRAGVHTGECEVRGQKLAGLAVHIGARVAARARGGEVLVSSTVKDLTAGAGIVYEDRGEHELKGVPGTWRLFAALRS
jgi:pimeloyl-ACP methyl ester carboxylesterase